MLHQYAPSQFEACLFVLLIHHTPCIRSDPQIQFNRVGVPRLPADGDAGTAASTPELIQHPIQNTIAR